MPTGSITLPTVVDSGRLSAGYPSAKAGQHQTRSVWIDLDNSPHVPLFSPVIKELQRRGHSVMVTARDCFQVCQLARLLEVECEVIGRHYGQNKILKLSGLGIRTAALVPAVLRQRPHLALSHGSRSQLLLCAALRIPSIVMVDYEFVSGLTALKPHWVMAPQAIPASAFRLAPERVIGYPGIKEDIYVPSFSINNGMRSSLGLGEDDLVVTIRPPANEAHYHNPESDILFRHLIDLLAATPDVRIVLLPRNDRQAESIRGSWPYLFECRKITIPARAVDGLNLIFASDLVVSGGGTMNREAAALGVPVYSIFRGKTGAVDRYLADAGRMVLIERPEDLRTLMPLRRRDRDCDYLQGNHSTLGFVVDKVQAILAGIAPGRQQALYGN